MYKCLLFLVFYLAYIKGEDEYGSQYYKSGVEAYLDERWDDCIKDFNKAIKLHNRINTAITDCRIRCDRKQYDFLDSRDIEDLHFYEKMIRKTLCFMECKRLYYPDVNFEYSPDLKILKNMEDLKMYDYLQTCYYQEKMLQEAASAAFTYLVVHPLDKVAKMNVEFYTGLPDIKLDEIINFENEEFVSLYMNGINTYKFKDWTNTIAYMEEAMNAYFLAEERCRVLCEGSFDQGWLPDFTASVANHFTFCLRCKQNCGKDVRLVGNSETLLADILNYLQFSYYQLRRTTEACQFVASYLLILPTDEDMLHNKKLYSDRCDDLMFTPHPEVVRYLTRSKYERKLLKYIDDSFNNEIRLQKLKRNQTKDADSKNNAADDKKLIQNDDVKTITDDIPKSDDNTETKGVYIKEIIDEITNVDVIEIVDESSDVESDEKQTESIIKNKILESNIEDKIDLENSASFEDNNIENK